MSVIIGEMAAAIGDICAFNYGEALTEDNRIPGNVPVYGSNGIVGWHDQAITQGPTIIIGRKGSIGEVHYSEVACYPIDTTYFIDGTKAPCDLMWLYYMLKAVDLTGLNKSAAVPGLNRDDAYREHIPLPPLAEQRRIAAILRAADDERRRRRYTQSLSDGLLGEVFVRMFGDPATNPMEWEVCTIDEVLSGTQYGTSQKSNQGERGYPILGMGNITYDGQVDLSSLAYVELSRREFQQLRLNTGDVIFNRTNSTDLVGKTACWRHEMDAVLASYLVRLTLRPTVVPEYFVAVLNTPYFKGQFQ